MRLTVSQTDLSNALNTVSKATAKSVTRSFKPVLEGVLLEAKNNLLTLTATDTELTITTQIEANIQQEGKTVIPADLLNRLVKTMTDDITITTFDNSQVELKSGGAVVTLSTLNAEEYPQIEDIGDNTVKITILQSMLKRMIQQVIYAASKDSTRPALCGVLFDIKNGYLTMVGVDGYRLALAKTEVVDNAINEVVIVPEKALKILLQMPMNDDVDIYIGDRQIRFNISASTAVTTTLIAGDFVDYTKIIPDTSKTTIYIQTQRLKDAIERALLASTVLENKLVRMQIEDSKLTLTANSEICKTEETIPIEYEGEELRIAFNSRYLLDALNTVRDTNIKIWFNGALNPCAIWPVEGEEYCHLILPVRVS